MQYPRPAGDIPTLGINEAGNWTYTLDGRTVELKDKEGNPCPAVPVDGSDGQTPTIRLQVHKEALVRKSVS